MSHGRSENLCRLSNHFRMLLALMAEGEEPGSNLPTQAGVAESNQCRGCLQPPCQKLPPMAAMPGRQQAPFHGQTPGAIVSGEDRLSRTHFAGKRCIMPTS
jgi:hypothetical protein